VSPQLKLAYVTIQLFLGPNVVFLFFYFYFYLQLNIANAFEIVTAGRTHYLIAESEIEMQEWIDVLSY